VADSGSRLYLGVNNVSYPDGVSLHDVAIWNEFGTKTAPPRPAFRMGMERGIGKSKKIITAQLANIARGALRGKAGKADNNKRMKVLLTALGKSAVKETKDIIQRGETAHNAPATVKKKGFDHPLFETGLLKKNVSYLVEIK